MEGGCLYTLLMESNRGSKVVQNIPYSLRLRFCQDISSGVAYLHNKSTAKRIVHGDIKPANILLTQTLDCKVADFGGADIATHSRYISKPRRREKGKHQETLGYLAPERRNSNVRVSKAMDVYGVGATMFVVLQREDPSYIPEEQAEQPSQFQKCDYSSTLSSAEIEHFKLLKQFMLKCCEKNPENRIDMITMRDSLTNHRKTCNECCDTVITGHVLSITEIRNLRSRSSNFSKPKILSEATFNDFDVSFFD